MSEIKVSQVGSRADRNAFIRFPWGIYDNDPAWVPPLIIERKAFLNRKRHPFYRHGDAALFLARQNQKIVGRIMASDDPNYNAVHHSNVGCFGLFECIDDRKVAAALFEAAEGWLRRKGRQEIMGPIDYSTNYVCGLLIAGFQFPPTILTAHNPPYYAELIEGCGFEKRMDFYAWWFSDATRAAARLRKLATRLGRRARFTIRQGNLKNLALEGERLRQIYNDAWKGNWGFVPFTEAEFAHLTGEMKPLLRPDFTAIAEVDGRTSRISSWRCPISMSALQKINGRLTTFGIPIGLVKLLYHKATTENGPVNCDGRASGISPTGSGRDVGVAGDGGGNGQSGIHGRTKHDVGKQRHDQPFPRSDRSDEIQDVSNLPQTVTLLTTTAK